MIKLSLSFLGLASALSPEKQMLLEKRQHIVDELASVNSFLTDNAFTWHIGSKHANSKVHQLKPGQKFLAYVTSNPSTGYEWQELDKGGATF